MAVTGLVGIAYLLIHMYGNLMILVGPEAFDEYAHHIRTFGEPMLPEKGLLWIIRVALLASLVLHVWAAATLWQCVPPVRTTTLWPPTITACPVRLS